MQNQQSFQQLVILSFVLIVSLGFKEPLPTKKSNPKNSPIGFPYYSKISEFFSMAFMYLCQVHESAPSVRYPRYQRSPPEPIPARALAAAPAPEPEEAEEDVELRHIEMTKRA